MRQTLLDPGLKESVNDKASFLHKENEKKLHGLTVAHGDDLLVAGDDKFYSVINEIKKYIKMRKKTAKISYSAE